MSAYDMSNYYGANEKGMTTQLNISNIDPNISTLDRSQIRAQSRVVPQQPIPSQPVQGRPLLSTLEALK